MAIDPVKQFIEEREERIRANGGNTELKNSAAAFNVESNKVQYSYNFSWMGRPIIQYPQDMIAMQEIIWKLQPDLIIETGVAHGGSLIFYASLLELIGKGEILGIDIDIREHNRKEIESHSMFKRIHLLQGSSTEKDTVELVAAFASGKKTVIVCLDSNHTHEHVLRELELYHSFVTPGSYLVVFDTIVEFLPEDYLPGRKWSPGNNPFTAVQFFLEQHSDFQVDESVDHKLLISVAPGGYLYKIR